MNARDNMKTEKYKCIRWFMKTEMEYINAMAALLSDGAKIIDVQRVTPLSDPELSNNWAASYVVFYEDVH